MPELPEVETTSRYLNKRLKGETVKDVWSGWKKAIKKPSSFSMFKKELIGRKILKVKRRGKNILFDLSDEYTLLLHQKMTGHLLIGKWKFVLPEKRKSGKKGGTGGAWVATSGGPLCDDPYNNYIRHMFWFESGKMMAFSDLRKFGKIILAPKSKLQEMSDIQDLGPEALEITEKEFLALFEKKKGRIKQVLMDQNFIVGIGNIYSDDILFEAKIHPLSKVERLKKEHLKKIYKAMRKILKKAIRLEGTSIEDYRKPDGSMGRYGDYRLVYQREGEDCPSRCRDKVERKKIGGRSAHFCPKCQKLIE